MSNQSNPDEKEQKRTGLTITTSVSISKEFSDIIKKFSLSPTEILRKGMGITLYEIGVPKYKTFLNEERSKKANEILKDIKENEDLIKKLKNLKEKIEELLNEL